MDGPVLTYLIESNDKAVAADARIAFGEDNVSVSSKLIGGVEVAVFLVAMTKPLKDLLKMILDFHAAKLTQYQSSKIVFGQESVELTGYSPDDVARLHELPMFAGLAEDKDGA